MTSKHPRSRGRAARRRELPRSLSDCTVTVIGLDRVGRLVAEQLAALGVGALTLVDSNRVTAHSQRSEGFTTEDIGRSRNSVVAQRCQEINPQLEVRLHTRAVAGAMQASHAVVCRSETLARAAIKLPKWNGFWIKWDASPRTLAITVEPGCQRLKRFGRQTDRSRRVTAQPPVWTADIIAGLIVHQIGDLVSGQLPVRRIVASLRDLTLGA